MTCMILVKKYFYIKVVSKKKNQLIINCELLLIPLLVRKKLNYNKKLPKNITNARIYDRIFIFINIFLN